MKKRYKTSWVGLMVLLAAGCAEPDNPSVGDCPDALSARSASVCDATSVNSFMQKASVNPVFNVSNKINIPPYSYIGGNYHSAGDVGMDSICSVQRDCCNALRLVDRFSSSPELRWTSVTNQLIVAAILSDPVELFANGLSIKNTSSIVWAWDSGMGTGTQSSGVTYVNYGDGKRVIDSKVTEQPLIPLEAGKMYAWCVWSWNDEGTQIVSSSAAIPFVVEDFNISGNISLVSGSWQLATAVREADARDVTATFPLTHMSIELNCKGGSCVVNKSKSMDITLRENQYVDFTDPDFDITSLKIKWLCPNSLTATTQFEGSEVETLFKR